MPTDALSTYQSRRETLLAHIVNSLSADERFLAAWLSGSFGLNAADPLSDLDLTLVVADPHGPTLCARPQPVSAHTTPERLELFSQFGQPAIIHENHHNAPEGGSFTFVLYAESALMVDWTLVPLARAERPDRTRLLFDQIGIPLSLSPAPDSLEQRMETASQTIAFFWMMTAITAKHVWRQDGVFVQCWLEELHRLVRDVERLIAGEARRYQRGSLTKPETTRAGQIRVIYKLCERMLDLMPEVGRLGGNIPPSPMPTLQLLLDLAEAS